MIKKLFLLLLTGLILAGCSGSQKGKNESASKKVAVTELGTQRISDTMVVPLETAEPPNPTPEKIKKAKKKCLYDFDLITVDGGQLSLCDYRGKVLIVDFWATWCGPCRIEIPGFVELKREYSNKDFEIIGVSLDRGGPSVVKSFAYKMGINYPLVMANRQILLAFGSISAIPTTFLLDRDGNIVKKYIGYNPKGEFEKEIDKLLNKAS